MNNLRFKRIRTGGILLALLFLTFYIRIQGVERIPDEQFTGNDAYLYYRQAQTIAEQGYLHARDMDRWLPLGRDNEQLLPLFSYAIAYTHKVFPLFSVYHIQLYSPSVCFTLALGVLFLFLTRCYGVMFASIVSLLLATLPGSISRSAAGFGDRDAWYYMLGVLVVTSYLWKEQMNPGRRRWIATALAGSTCFLGGMSWEGFGVFGVMIVAIELYKFCTTDTEQHLKEYLLYLLMFVPWLYLISPAYRSGYGFSTHVTALMLFPPLVVYVLRGTRYLLLHFYQPLRHHGKKLAWGLTCLAITTGITYILVQAGTFAETAYPFNEIRLIKDVGELADPHFRYWTRRYGAIFVLGKPRTDNCQSSVVEVERTTPCPLAHALHRHNILSSTIERCHRRKSMQYPVYCRIYSNRPLTRFYLSPSCRYTADKNVRKCVSDTRYACMVPRLGESLTGCKTK